jgi:hypothetical protein
MKYDRNHPDYSGSNFPAYPVALGVTVAKLRAKAHHKGGLKGLTKTERQAYGEAVGKAILAKQRSEAHQGLPPLNPKARCASGTFYSDGADIHNAIRRKQAAALLAAPSQIRRRREPREWQRLYDEAMAEKREARHDLAA